MQPNEYFDYIKGKAETISREDLKKCMENMAELARKYSVTGQKRRNNY